MAIDSWNSRNVRLAISLGTNLEERDRLGNTALLSLLCAYEQGALWGTLDSANLLLTHGADVCALKKVLVPENRNFLCDDKPRLEIAYRSTLMFNVPACLQEKLLKRGAPLYARGPLGKDALMFAAASGQVESEQRCEALLGEGADPTWEDDAGNTALFYAGERKTLLLLNRYKAEINHRNRNGESALMYHLRNKSPKDVITTLVELGIDKSIEDNHGNRAKEFARIFHWTKKVQEMVS